MYPLLTPSVTAPAKKIEHSIWLAFQSSSLIQVFWVGGGGGSVNCLHLYVHLYVTPGEVSR